MQLAAARRAWCLLGCCGVAAGGGDGDGLRLHTPESRADRCAPASAGPSWALGARPQPASPDLNSGGKVSFSVAQRSAPPGPRAGFPGARRGPSGTFPGPDRFRARSRGPNSAASRPPPRGARQAVLAAGEISGRRRECWFWISPDGSR